MGVRIEHSQSFIDQAQYGKFATHPALGAADYHLAVHLPGGKSVYTFCMCPGGFVVAAASECGGVVTNGMSYSGRKGDNANSALLVSLQPHDFPDQSTPLGGIYWQRELEKACYRAGGGKYYAPSQLVGDFLANRASISCGLIQPTYRPGITWSNLHQILPPVLTTNLQQGLVAMDKIIPGFAGADNVLTAVESRSSSPVRIMRG